MEKGLVVGVKDNKITVRLATTEACQKCGGCSIKDGQSILDIDNTVGAKEGDTVFIENDPSNFLTAAFILYIIPVVFLILGYFFGQVTAQVFNLPDKFAVLIAVLIFASSFVFISQIDKRIGKKSNMKPVVVKKI